MTEESSGEFKIETPATPESTEAVVEAAAEPIKEVATQQSITALQPSVISTQTTPAPPPEKDPLLKNVESILSENIGSFYGQLSQEKKQEFKSRGEIVAKQITGMIKTGALQIKKILTMITEWLRLIPGVNVFFLEQEGKIKTDQLIELSKRQ